MRELKFRIWDTVNKCWLDYDELFINQEGEIYEIEERTWSYQTYMHKENLTEKLKLVQYTGLKDKHGKEIYEGDIVIGVIGEVYNGLLINHIEEKGEIKFIDGGFDLNAYPIGAFTEIEVIGNIYENPDLFEQEANQ